MTVRIGCFPQQDRKTGRWFLQEAYRRAMEDAGVVTEVLLPSKNRSFEELLNAYDGFLFPGGPDVNPLVFGEDVETGCGVINRTRDQLELACLRLLTAKRKPVLGICRGIQMMNVALGGDLYQDLSAATKQAHYQTAPDEIPTHRVFLSKQSMLFSILGREQLDTNSFHHQGIRRMATELQVCGRTRDGLVEAVELRGHPFYLGVQWHPEHMCEELETGIILFQAFARACERLRDE